MKYNQHKRRDKALFPSLKRHLTLGPMKNFVIGIIGAGNMGMALASGLIAAAVPAQNIIMSSRDSDRRQEMERLGIIPEPHNDTLVSRADILVLAVKPQHLPGLCHAIAPACARRHPLVVSVAAGVRTADLARWLGDGLSIVRSMPNTPALINAGVSVLYAGNTVTEAERNAAEGVIGAVSQVFWVSDESLMDAATAVSGSGPAYVFLFVEAFVQAAIAAGLPPELSTALVTHTALGAARMIAGGAEDPATLRARVTSPGGTTEQAIKTFMNGGFIEMFTDAVLAARARSQQLGEQLGAL